MTNEQWHTATQDIADEHNVNEDITNGPNTLYISANSHDTESNLDSRSSESTCNTDSSELSQMKIEHQILIFQIPVIPKSGMVI